MIKVIHILSDTNIGGAGTLLINYLKNFDKNKFLIKVMLPKGSLLIPRVEALGYEVIVMEGNRDKSLDFKAINEIKKILKKEKPDIVHTHSSMSGKIAGFLAGVKTRMYTRHCAYDPKKFMTVFPCKAINGFINNTLSTHIIAVAEAAKKNLTDTGVCEKKISVIINGVDALPEKTKEEKEEIRKRYNIKPEDFVFGIVARLEKVKGHEYFIESAAKILTEYDNVKFLIVGTGALEKELKEKVSKLGLNDKIIFTGFITDVSEIYNIMDMNVNCSYGTETSSLALSEAMSVGVPAIASIYGGNPYMVTEGENGLLCAKQNVDALYEKMKYILENPDIYQKMKETAKEHYQKKFTAKKMTETLEKIYENQYERNSKK